MRTGGYVQRVATLTTSQQSLSYLHVEHIYTHAVHFFLVANQTKGGKIQAASTLNRTSHRTYLTNVKWNEPTTSKHVSCCHTDGARP